MVGEIVEEDGVIYRVIDEDKDGTQKLEWVLMQKVAKHNFRTHSSEPGVLISTESGKRIIV